MAFLTTETFALTGDDIIDVMTTGGRWILGEDRVMHWAVSGGLSGEQWFDQAVVQRELSKVLDSIEPFINVDFQFLGFYANPIAAGDAGGDLNYAPDTSGLLFGPQSAAYAQFPEDVFFPTNLPDYPMGWDSQPGDTFYDTRLAMNDFSSIAPGSDSFSVVLHETLHGLGLKHTFDSGNSNAPRPTLADVGRAELDIDWISVMSYSDDFESDTRSFDPAAPMVLDVLALQWLYGANTETNAGDSRLYLENVTGYRTIWDPSGLDVVDMSRLSDEGWRVDLPWTVWSDANPVLVGSAAPRSQFDEASPMQNYWLMGNIEDALGSQFGDVINGNAFSNILNGAEGDDILQGYEGDDTLLGGAGDDLALYAGPQSAYTLEVSANGVTLIDRRADMNGRDLLQSVERIQFDEQLPILGEAPMRLDLFDDAAKISLEAFLEITEIYIAYFNRAPDALGLAYWASEFERGFTREEIATSFFDQVETRATYPDLSDTEAFVRAVYNNVLGRAPDDEGFAYWVGELNNNPAITEPIFILAIINGAIGPDVDYLRSKSDVGLYYAVERGMSDVENSRAVMALYDGSDASIASANAESDRLYDLALNAETGAFLMPIIGVLDDGIGVA